MKYLSGPVIPKLANTTHPSSEIKYLINNLLYNESKTNRWNISADINFGNDDKVVVPLGRIANTECLIYSLVNYQMNPGTNSIK